MVGIKDKNYIVDAFVRQNPDFIGGIITFINYESYTFEAYMLEVGVKSILDWTSYCFWMVSAGQAGAFGFASCK